MEQLIEICFGMILIALTVMVMWVLLAIIKSFSKNGVSASFKAMMDADIEERYVITGYQPKKTSERHSD